MMAKLSKNSPLVSAPVISVNQLEFIAREVARSHTSYIHTYIVSGAGITSHDHYITNSVDFNMDALARVSVEYWCTVQYLYSINTV